jgi:hypothetical protein
MLVLSFVYTWQFGDAGLGLTWHGLVQSDPVWQGQIWRFICKCKTSLI